ncbi:hypothetical protein EUCA11A_29050 [Eubacterium callanderi]|uniref:CapA family protein n=1 Tax=Eubacterium callanderi TaxID=53442 RepID=UPI0029FF006A|nr:CapA family protein [Eubacterium callanderi]WPK68731.1 hypothetical protein EUCA2A_29050 [Eubacterium callanderi]WPK73029.1 hypothetical protein EUCA11A_29050 [Eubacterium callanderi]
MCSQYFKISFTGDIMCEKRLLKASYEGGRYNFDKVFENINLTFQKSDIVVGNLETIFAGKKAGYTKELYSFNTPDEFAKALKKSGITYVSTANNHCLDRGVQGLIRTLNILDEVNIKHFGTARTEIERNEVVAVQIGNKKVALLSYTYGTNTEENNILLDDQKMFLVNCLKSQKNELEKFKKSINISGWRAKTSKAIRKITSLEQRMKLKLKLGILNNVPQIDNITEGDIIKENIQKMKIDVQKAKKNFDCVIMCLHCGGLFNTEIGTYTKYIVRELEKEKIDLIVGNHPHVVQKFQELNNSVKIAYSLGNLSISPSSIYVIHENHPEISVLLHVYFQRETARIEKITFSLLKILEDKKGQITIYEISALNKKLQKNEDKKRLFIDVKEVYAQFTGNSDDFQIKDEYFIWER